MSNFLHVILDQGYSSTKVGFAKEEFPRWIIPSVLGYSNSIEDPRKIAIGEKALNDPNLHLLTPTHEGLDISDIRILVKFWEKLFLDIMQINPNNYELVLTIPPLMLIDSMKQLKSISTQILEFQEIHFHNQQVCSLLEDQKSTGLVVDIGG